MCVRCARLYIYACFCMYLFFCQRNFTVLVGLLKEIGADGFNGGIVSTRTYTYTTVYTLTYSHTCTAQMHTTIKRYPMGKPQQRVFHIEPITLHTHRYARVLRAYCYNICAQADTLTCDERGTAATAIIFLKWCLFMCVDIIIFVSHICLFSFTFNKPTHNGKKG